MFFQCPASRDRRGSDRSVWQGRGRHGKSRRSPTWRVGVSAYCSGWPPRGGSRLYGAPSPLAEAAFTNGPLVSHPTGACCGTATRNRRPRPPCATDSARLARGAVCGAAAANTLVWDRGSGCSKASTRHSWWT